MLKIKLIFFILLTMSLGFHVPSDAYAADGDVTSTVEINSSTANGPTLSNSDFFGVSVANIGDLDGDGVNDLAVGAPYDNEGGAQRGAVHIMYMNTDGSVDSTVEINSSTTNGPTLDDTDRFGSSVANIGDLDGDGVNDLAVGAYGDDEGGSARGAVHIMFMNTDGSIDSTVEINSSTTNGPTLTNSDFFGNSVANIGDLNNDGVNDIAVGAYGDDEGGSARGAVHIMYMNTDGSIDSTVEINSSTANGPTLDNLDYFGMSVANIGDLNNDGVNDIAVGANGDDEGGASRGAVHIMYMNTDGSVDSTVEINSSTANGPTLDNLDYFGMSVANIGDLNNDGVNDLAVGATGDDEGGASRGAVHIMFMNTDGSVDSTVEINDSTTNGPTLSNSNDFGNSVTNIGDLDGDGVNDIAVGANADDEGGSDRGAVHIMYMVGSTVPDKVGTVSTSSSANLSWSAPSANGNAITDYIIQYSTDNSTWSTFADGVSTATTATVTGLSDGTTYYFQVAAVNSLGTGSFSSSSSVSVTSSSSSSSSCYDCEAPKLTKFEVHVSSSPFDYVWNFDQDTPYPMFGDDITPIVADPGDEVEIILELTDNRTLKRIVDSGMYTNFLTKPNDMNTFYANNFDESGKVSTTYYEWHQTGEDLVYDYANTVEWSEDNVTIRESGEFTKDGPAENLDDLIGTFSISFKMKFLQPMQTTDVWVQAIDRSGNFFKVALPLTLKISGNEPLLFESQLNQKVLSFFDESMLFKLVSDWNGSSQDVSELATILGIPDEQLPSWVANLAVWVSEDRITLADMIVSIEHLINN